MANADDDEGTGRADDADNDPGFDDSASADPAPDDSADNGNADDTEEEPPDWEDEDYGGDGDDDDEDFDEDDEYEEGGSSTFLFLAIGLGFLIILSGIGVGAWYFIKSDDMQVGSQLDLPQEGALTPPAVESAETGQTPSEEPAEEPTEEPAEVAQIAGGASLNDLTNVGGLNALAGGGLNAVTSGSAATAGLIIPASTLVAYEPYVDYPSPSPLPRAPDPAFLQNRDGGEAPLPKIAPDGRVSWEFYGRPLVPDTGAKRVAILVTGMGLSTAETLAAIRKLPPEVTLSFSPYSDDLEQWLLRSRRVGHEVMLGLPLESVLFPVEDPGPLALRTDFSAPENLLLTEKILSLFHGYTGLEVHMGSKFVTSELDVRELLNVLNRRGLMIMDGAWNTDSFIPKVSKELGMPRVISDLRLDDVMALSAIDAKLKELDALVMTNGQAVATTGMSPAVMDRLKSWILTLADRGIELVPISTLVDLSLPEPS